jgi:hypothetical protein
MNIRSPVLVSLLLVLSLGAQDATPALEPVVRPPLRELALPANPKLPSLFLVGASDVSAASDVRRVNGLGLRGWAELLPKYFDTSKINVVNRALGGLSARIDMIEGEAESGVEVEATEVEAAESTGTLTAEAETEVSAEANVEADVNEAANESVNNEEDAAEDSESSQKSE